jgi:putative glutathione S-transferase
MAIPPTPNDDAKKPRINLEGDKKTGAYKRHQSAHRNFVGSDQHPIEAGRYHLHVALACPWADGTLAALFLKGLEGAVSYSVVHPTWSKTDSAGQHHGWVYRSPGDEPIPNPLGHGANECDDALIPDPSGIKSIRELYELSGDYQGPFTTPVLFDKKLNRIVNNESTEILRMLNFDFNDHAKNAKLNLYPEAKGEELAKLNETTIYPKVCVIKTHVVSIL